MCWPLSDVELSQAMFAAAPNAGAMAVIKYQFEPEGASAARAQRDVLRASEDAGRVYSMSGTLLSTLSLDAVFVARGGLGWTSEQRLVVAYVNGRLVTFDVQGRQRRLDVLASSAVTGDVTDNVSGANAGNTASKGSRIEKDARIVCVHVFSAGVILATDQGRVIRVTALSTPHPQVVVLNQGNPVTDRIGSVISCMCVVIEARWARKNKSVPAGPVPQEPQGVVIVATSDAGLVRVSLDGSALAPAGSLSTPNHSANQSQQAQVIYGLVDSKISHLAAAPNGKFVACFTAERRLVALSTDLTKRVLDFDSSTHADVLPHSMLWCGEDAVVIHWARVGLLVVGPFGDWVKYQYAGPVLLAGELDCCRIWTSEHAEILQRVPATTVCIHEIASFDPSAMLLDATEALAADDPNADGNIRVLKADEKLVEGVMDCVQAALDEFSVPKQQHFLRAAAGGKSFCESEKDRRQCTTAFSTATRVLRALNAVRHEMVGMPLTIKQFGLLTPHGLVDRLLARKQYFLALKLCEYLRIPTAKRRVIVEWACAKLHSEYHGARLRRNRSGSSGSLRSFNGSLGVGRRAHGGGNRLLELDDRLYATITEKMLRCPGISYVRVAAKAEECGRRQLATQFLDCEMLVHLRVVQQLDMGEFDSALATAVTANDPNLIFAVLNHCCQVMSRTGRSEHDFFKLLGKSPLARDLWISYLVDGGAFERSRPTAPAPVVSSTNPFADAVNDEPAVSAATLPISNSFGRDVIACLHALGLLIDEAREITRAGRSLTATADGGNASLPPSLAQQQLEQHNLLRAHKVYSRGGASLSFHATAVEEQRRLVAHQRALEASTGMGGFTGESVMATVFKCLVLDRHKEAEALRSEFNLTSASYWRLRVRALVSCQDWVALAALADTKKSPVGYAPFAFGCAEKGNPDEAVKYAKRMDDAEARLEVYIAVQRWDEAVEEAMGLKDVEVLVRLKEDLTVPRHVAMKAESCLASMM
jgi:hypothetical protein